MCVFSLGIRSSRSVWWCSAQLFPAVKFTVKPGSFSLWLKVSLALSAAQLILSLSHHLSVVSTATLNPQTHRTDTHTHTHSQDAPQTCRGRPHNLVQSQDVPQEVLPRKQYNGAEPSGVSHLLVEGQHDQTDHLTLCSVCLQSELNRFN